MFEQTKLEPCYNLYQYLIVFLVAIIFDLFIHFFSSRSYAAVKSGTQSGYVPAHLMAYYNYLDKYFNSWLLGCLITGVSVLLIVIVTDLVLQGIEYRYSGSD